jgi:signal transduction histidine kinase
MKYGYYLASVGSVLAIAFAEVALHAPIGDKSRFLVMLIPVAVMTWGGGTGPGFVALGMGSLVGAVLLPPKYLLAIDSPSDVASLVLFVVVGLVLIAIIEGLKRSRQALADSEARVISLNADLKHSLGAKEEALRRQKQFTSDASHELKTPLTAIRARSGIALSNPAEPGELLEHISAMSRAADIMIEVVQDLMLLAASDEGQLNLKKERVSAEILIEDALASVDVAKHQLVVSVDPNLELECDPSAITRVLVNLLQNAIVHTPEDRIIGVSCFESGESVTMTVRDNGAGIPEAHLKQIFDRFHRVDGSRDRRSGGTGLGLAIAKAIIESHGGTIELTSTLGEGTCASVVIPR